MELNLTPEQQQLVRALVRETARILGEEGAYSGPGRETVNPLAFGSTGSTIYNHLLDLHRQNEATAMMQRSQQAGVTPPFGVQGTLSGGRY